jgi:large subunit ribosomal protein L29
MAKTSELRSQSNEELAALIAELDEKIFKLRNEFRTTRKLEKPHILSLLKRERAQVLTILTEKKNG